MVQHSHQNLSPCQTVGSRLYGSPAALLMFVCTVLVAPQSARSEENHNDYQPFLAQLPAVGPGSVAPSGPGSVSASGQGAVPLAPSGQPQQPSPYSPYWPNPAQPVPGLADKEASWSPYTVGGLIVLMATVLIPSITTMIKAARTEQKVEGNNATISILQNEVHSLRASVQSLMLAATPPSTPTPPTDLSMAAFSAAMSDPLIRMPASFRRALRQQSPIASTSTPATVNINLGPGATTSVHPGTAATPIAPSDSGRNEPSSQPQQSQQPTHVYVSGDMDVIEQPKATASATPTPTTS